ncbi:MFS transporter [Agromyces sp. NPDC058136]|uniref:MFS transporter n=1 Tax=Agromyces sp. NPDC058136 TaxID=3346354 RepID=UPI0036D87B73
MTPTPVRPLWAGRALALVGIVLVAFNLRTAVASLSPVLGRIEAEIELAPVVVGFLGMLPPLCYAVFGIATPRFAKRFGLERTLVVALAALALGLAGRGFAGSALALVGASALAFAAIGVGNVLLPPLVKRYFPDRIGLVTTLYVTAMSVSTFIPPLIAVPVADAAGWRVSIGEWAIVAGLALVPWLVMLVRPAGDRGASASAPSPEEPAAAGFGRMLRSLLAWALVVVFGVGSFNAYAAFAWMPQIVQDTAGTTAAEAGAMLALLAAVGLPIGVVVPMVAARYGRIRLLIGISTVSFVAGYLGLLLAPAAAVWLWMVLIGTGQIIFPLALVLINLRSRTHAGAVSLSGFVQSFGYVLAALGPIAVAGLHEATGAWTAPLVLLLVSVVPAAVAGVVVARPRYVEDDATGR